jgi:hypothetical protein
MEKKELSLQEKARAMKAFATKDWVTYVDVIFDNIVINGPASPLKAALLSGPTTPEETAALQQHTNDKDLAALNHEFTHEIVTADAKKALRYLQVVVEVLDKHKQNELLREILRHFKQ